MKCTNCGHTIRPDREEAMTGMDCAFDFYIDLMRLAYIGQGDAENEENNNDDYT